MFRQPALGGLRKDWNTPSPLPVPTASRPLPKPAPAIPISTSAQPQPSTTTTKKAKGSKSLSLDNPASENEGNDEGAEGGNMSDGGEIGHDEDEQSLALVGKTKEKTPMGKERHQRGTKSVSLFHSISYTGQILIPT